MYLKNKIIIGIFSNEVVDKLIRRVVRCMKWKINRLDGLDIITKIEQETYYNVINRCMQLK